MTGGASVGFFGKLPCNGDFLQRRAPQEFVDAWDPWLQQCIHESRQALRERWLDAYLTGPVWRFVISGGVCGSGAYAGVMLPSVDRVGRYFPLTLVAQVDTEESPIELACRGSQWFEAAEALAISALEATEIDLDSFDEQVASLAAHLPPNAAGHTSALWAMQEQIGFPAQGHQWQIALPGARDLQTALNVLAYRVLAGQLRPLTLWWTDGASAVSPSWLVLRGLPTPASFTAMLAGQWQHCGWSSADASFEPAQAYADPLNMNDQAARVIGEEAGRAATPPSPSGNDILVRFDAPTSRLSAVEQNRAAYVARPQIGLWAIATPGSDTSNLQAVQMVADLLNQLPDAGSLSALVEAARTALMEGHRHIVLRGSSQANALVMLVKGRECALLTAGSVQLLRARGNQLQAIVDLQPVDAAAMPSSAPSDGGNNSLMALFNADARGTPPIGVNGLDGIGVRYELLMPGDYWMLFGHASVDDDARSRIGAALASGMPLSAASIAELLGGSAAREIAGSAEPALVLLEVTQ